jgi:hypothetical protein
MHHLCHPCPSVPWSPGRVHRVLLAALTAVLLLTTAGQSSLQPVTVRLTELEAVSAGTSNPQGGSAYRFSGVLDGKPIRWDPCTPIHWQFRSAQAPAGGQHILAAAIARISQATRIRWIFDGTVTTTPTSAWLPRTLAPVRPVLIGWTDAHHSDLLRNQSQQVLGVTGTVSFSRANDQQRTAEMRGAVIALNASRHEPANGPVSWKTVALHELGHAMGLAHAGSTRELMYPILGRGLTDLQDGDLTGLNHLGRAAGCQRF